MKRPITWTEFGNLKRHVLHLEKRLKVIKSQNVRITEKCASLIHNQKHYLEKKGTREILRKRYYSKLSSLNSTYSSLLKFLQMTTIPRPHKATGRNQLVRLTQYEYNKLLSLLKPS